MGPVFPLQCEFAILPGLSECSIKTCKLRNYCEYAQKENRVLISPIYRGLNCAEPNTFFTIPALALCPRLHLRYVCAVTNQNSFGGLFLRRYRQLLSKSEAICVRGFGGRGVSDVTNNPFMHAKFVELDETF